MNKEIRLKDFKSFLSSFSRETKINIEVTDTHKIDSGYNKIILCIVIINNEVLEKQISEIKEMSNLVNDARVRVFTRIKNDIKLIFDNAS